MLLLADNCCYNGIGVTAPSRAMAPPAPRARLGHRLPAPQYPSAVAARTTQDRPLSRPAPSAEPRRPPRRRELRRPKTRHDRPPRRHPLLAYSSNRPCPRIVVCRYGSSALPVSRIRSGQPPVRNTSSRVTVRSLRERMISTSCPYTWVTGRWLRWPITIA